jgi:hypothetical protein
MRGIFSGAPAPADSDVREAFEHATPASIATVALTQSPTYASLFILHLFSAGLLHRLAIILNHASATAAEYSNRQMSGIGKVSQEKIPDVGERYAAI